MAGHVSPEAACGGPIAAVNDGDIIEMDISHRTLHVELSITELRARMARWKPPALQYPSGVFGKYARMVSSASRGATTSDWGTRQEQPGNPASDELSRCIR